MRNGMKRLVSVIICLALVLTLMSMGIYAADTTTLYCAAPSGWASCYVYWWGSADTNPGWPGEAMTKGADGIWYYEVPSDAGNVIFNNGSGTQSDDLAMPTDGNVQFNYVSKTWGPYTGIVEEPEISYVTVYVEAPASWGTPNAYWWGSAVENSAAWPGNAMTYVDGNVYSAVVPADCTGLIFNGNGGQTSDLTVPTDDNVMYSVASSSWGQFVINEPVEVTFTYVVAGSEGLCGTAWDYANIANTMTVDGDVASITYPNVAEGNYEFKVVMVGSDGSAQWYGTGVYGEDNVAFTVSTACDVVITFHLLDNAVAVNGTGLGDPEPPIPMEFDYYVAGSEGLVGVDWDPSAVMMTETEEGIFQTTFYGVQPGTYEFKITTGSWDTPSFGIGDNNGNFVFNVYAECDVTITFAEEDGGIWVEATNNGLTAPVGDVTVYVEAPASWGTPNIYWWGGSAEAPAWPGYAMTHYEGNVYSYVIPSDVSGLLFNGTEGQTADLLIPTDDNVMYSVATSSWGPLVINEPVEVTYTYVVAGSEELCGTAWDIANTANEMIVSDGVVSLTYSSVVAGDYEFKVVKVGSDGSAQWFGLGEDNVSFTVAAESDVTITMSLTDNVITVTCAEVEVPVVDPGLVLNYPTLSFEDEIIYNVYFSVADTTSIVEMGLMILPKMDQTATIADAVALVPGYVTNGIVYLASSEGVPAANMGDTLYFKVYAKLTDGSYAYSGAGGYNAKAYANSILSGNNTTEMKALVVSMLNYGAEAQLYFGHNTDKLVNNALTAEQQALVSAYDATMMDALVKADTSKTTNFVRVNTNFRQLYPSVSFDGAFAINFYCAPAIKVDSGMTLYYWDMETMAEVDQLTVDNAIGSMEMTDTNGMWWGQVPGIAAKEMDKTYYVTCVFESDGETITTGVIAYSLGKYCSDKAAADGDAQQSFAQATAVYGYYAKSYFASIA